MRLSDVFIEVFAIFRIITNDLKLTNLIHKLLIIFYYTSGLGENGF